MNNRRMAAALALAGLFSLALGAQSAELKARFLERKPLLDALKNAGRIGENNLGVLEFRPGVPPAAADSELVSAENADRQTVYAEIAARLNISAAEVGKRRAMQIAQQAAPSHWLQDADGNWYRKT